MSPRPVTSPSCARRAPCPVCALRPTSFLHAIHLIPKHQQCQWFARNLKGKEHNFKPNANCFCNEMILSGIFGGFLSTGHWGGGGRETQRLEIPQSQCSREVCHILRLNSQICFMQLGKILHINGKCILALSSCQFSHVHTNATLMLQDFPGSLQKPLQACVEEKMENAHYKEQAHPTNDLKCGIRVASKLRISFLHSCQ